MPTGAGKQAVYTEDGDRGHSRSRRLPELARPIPGSEAFGLYEANWRHINQTSLCLRERTLMAALAERFGVGYLLTTK